MKQVNKAKRDFILQFLLNARLSGRHADTNGSNDRKEIVEAASDLFDRAHEISHQEGELDEKVHSSQ